MNTQQTIGDVRGTSCGEIYPYVIAYFPKRAQHFQLFGNGIRPLPFDTYALAHEHALALKGQA